MIRFNGADAMRQLTITFAVIALAAQTAQAGHLGFGPGGLGLGGHHGEFRHGGGPGGFGGFGLDTEQIQTRFEDKFADLQTDYDTGLEEIDDFYSSDEYGDVVDGVERLTDRYDLFLSGVERSIERLGDFIEIVTDDLTFYDELIAEYEARDDLSAERLERILDRLTNQQERLTTKIDFLTEKQTSLSESLPTFQDFSSGLSTYLADIISAGGGTIDDSSNETAAAMLAASALRSTSPLAALVADESFCETPSAMLEATVAPEPAAILLSLMAASIFVLRRPKRRQRTR
jgi:hypothetical protein